MKRKIISIILVILLLQYYCGFVFAENTNDINQTSNETTNVEANNQISEELSKLGFDIDKKKIQIDGDINTLGTHNVKIVLHKKVLFDIKVVLKK